VEDVAQSLVAFPADRVSTALLLNGRLGMDSREDTRSSLGTARVCVAPPVPPCMPVHRLPPPASATAGVQVFVAQLSGARLIGM